MILRKFVWHTAFLGRSSNFRFSYRDSNVCYVDSHLVVRECWVLCKLLDLRHL
jgi:hypothetical protein